MNLEDVKLGKILECEEEFQITPEDLYNIDYEVYKYIESGDIHSLMSHLMNVGGYK